LEYGDFRLVRESLRERGRLMRLAPQFVRPLRLYMPVRQRMGGLTRGAFRFCGGSRSRLLHWLCAPLPGTSDRGLWVARLGLWLYDRLANDADIPPHSVCRVGTPASPAVNGAQYRWLCGYTDAQMQYPERFTLALLEDARQLAEEYSVEFRVWTHHRAVLVGDSVEIRRRPADPPVSTVRPQVVVNATGAWGDLTLGESKVPSERLFGGTKGSHFLTYNRRFREQLGDGGVYAEAVDGRLVFVLPFGQGVLVGTTDERFEDRPDRAVATDAELQYLLGMVNSVFPGVHLSMADIDLHYSGVRPLPHVTGAIPGAIPRGHQIVEHSVGGTAIYTLIGGKLTTCRALAEEAADRVFERIGVARRHDSRHRIVPGGEGYPSSDAAVRLECDRLASRFGIDVSQVEDIWSLCGTRCESILAELEAPAGESLIDTNLPLEFVRWVIRREWVATLDDLVERRLMLVYRPRLSRACLDQLAHCLAEAGRLAPVGIESAVESTVKRLKTVYGRLLEPKRAETLTTDAR
jgi:glycerol-3-phosphate dehydrogenase